MQSSVSGTKAVRCAFERNAPSTVFQGSWQVRRWKHLEELAAALVWI